MLILFKGSQKKKGKRLFTKLLNIYIYIYTHTYIYINIDTRLILKKSYPVA